MHTMESQSHSIKVVDGDAPIKTENLPVSPRQGIVIVEDVPSNEVVAVDTVRQVAANEEFFAPAVLPQEGKNMVVAESAPKREVALFEEKQPESNLKREGKIRIGLVDATSLMESRVRDIADERMTTEKGELHGVSGVFQKIWKHNLAREYYRQKEMVLVRESIAKSGTTFIDREDMDQDKSTHQVAMGAIAERFVTEGEEMLHSGENRKALVEDEQSESQQSLKDLVLRYGKGEIQDAAAFQMEKQKLIENMKGSDAHVKFADNLFKVAQQVRQAIDHGESVAALEKDMEIVTGQARGGVRMEANLSSCDRLIEKLHSTKLGAMVNETTLSLAVGAAWSLGVFAGTRLTSSKLAALASFGGTAALGAGVAAMRESGHMKQDRAQHTRDMAQGKAIDPENGKRRQEMQESTYEMRGAKDLAMEMQNALFESDAKGKMVLRQNLGQSEINDALKSLSEAEARIKLSDTKNIDLLSYTSAGDVEKERFELDLARAKTKVEVRKLLEAHPEILSQDGGNINITPERYLQNYLAVHTKDMETSLGGEVSKRDELFETMRQKHMGKAALKALGTGLLVGTAAQELAAFATDQQGLIEGWVSGHHDTSSSETLAHYLLGGKMAEVPLHDTIVGSHHFKLPEGVSFAKNADGSYGLMRGDELIAQGLHIDKSGMLTPESQQSLGALKIGLHENAVNVTGGHGAEHVSTKEWMAQQQGATDVKRLDWYDNNTPSHFDQNELKLQWGGDHGTGIDHDGNYVFNVKHMIAGGSHHGELSADAQQLAKDGKLEMIISASKETQGHVLKVPINADGTVAFNPKDAALAKFFTVHDGKAVFVGKYAEVAEIVKSADAHDTTEQVRILATHIGKDSMDTLVTAEHITTLNIPPHELTPIIPMTPISGRNPLEKMKKRDDEDNALSETPPVKPIDPETPLLTQLPPEGDGMPAYLIPQDRGLPPSEATVKGDIPTQSTETIFNRNNPSGDHVAQSLPKDKFPPQQEAVAETRDADFFKRRMKYESNTRYYGKFQEFVTKTLSMPLDATYDEIRKKSKSWMQKNADRTGANDRNETALKMTKALNELKNQHKAQRQAELANNPPDKETVETVPVQEVVPQAESVEFGEEIKSVQRKAKAIGKVWEKNRLSLPNGASSQDTGAQILQGLFDRVMQKNDYSDEQAEVLATALKQEGIIVRKTADVSGKVLWRVSLEDIDKAA